MRQSSTGNLCGDEDEMIIHKVSQCCKLAQKSID